MIDNKKVLAVIPARGGSKRLPGKNTKLLNGKPLIAWSIEAAKSSQLIDRVVVSTDDEGIASVSRAFGADVPFLRPAGLSGDHASTDSAIIHALDTLPMEYGVVVILQPTSPLRTADDIDNALAMLNDTGVNGVVSVCECEHPPLWSNTLPDDRLMGGFLRPSVLGKRSQDLQQYYRLNGCLYAFDVEAYRQRQGTYYSDDVKAYIMPSERSVDIDTQVDFCFAEALISYFSDGKTKSHLDEQKACQESILD
ncbi:cytidylyltransferase domain-containing protein [Photobacterium rosenbergii]|uniref:acylneuraminate cytidylyltransferase family protein n=1 Tax=Photobacterium rosenbergii TaxID=294936 RepID=UPI001C994402|nr:acylneuraminate cytidylyltransferase family protein [Photobacterium rosenbergii]MBY5947301.1 acylneuraminate cytidylyltransferase family protein [Photobacterium rosenbergii]